MYRQGLLPYIQDLASQKPAPGGGSAAGLVLALGISLFEMALRISFKKLDSAQQKTLEKSFSRFLRLREKALTIVDRDSAVFQRFSQEQHKQRKQKLLNQALVLSEELADCALAVLHEAENLRSVVSRRLLGDFSVGFSFSCAALKTALINMKANTEYLGFSNQKVQGKIRAYRKAFFSYQARLARIDRTLV